MHAMARQREADSFDAGLGGQNYSWFTYKRDHDHIDPEPGKAGDLIKVGPSGCCSPALRS